MIVFKLINFIVFAAGIFFAFRGLAKKWWIDRHTSIGDTIGRVSQLFDSTTAESAKWKSNIIKMNDDAEKLIDDYKKEGDLEKFKLVELAHKYANKLRSDAAMSARQEMDIAIMDIRRWTAREAIATATSRLVLESTGPEQATFTKQATEEIENSL